MFSEVCLEQTCLVCRKAPPGYEGKVAKECMERIQARPCSCTLSALSAAHVFDILNHSLFRHFHMNLKGAENAFQIFILCVFRLAYDVSKCFFFVPKKFKYL